MESSFRACPLSCARVQRKRTGPCAMHKDYLILKRLRRRPMLGPLFCAFNRAVDL